MAQAPASDRIGNVQKAKAYWVIRNMIAWFGAETSKNYRLYHAEHGGIQISKDGVQGGSPIELQIDPDGLPASVTVKFPQLVGATALNLPDEALRELDRLLKGQLVLVKAEFEEPLDATSLQLPGVLDDEFLYEGPLGA